MQENILIVEDDTSVAEGLEDLLSSYGYRVFSASSSRSALDLLQKEPINLAVLDIYLGGYNGYDLCRRIRETWDTPILFLTALSSELELVRGFQAGGDDYVTKPFRMQEILVRIQALIRRAGMQNPAQRKTGGLIYDRARQQIVKASAPIELTVTEWKLASALIEHWPQALSREELLYQVWDKDAAFVETNTLRVNISRLREKLGEFQGAPYIVTVRGIGYRWAVAVQ